MLESWIVGALILVLLVALHWLAFRIQVRRSGAKRGTRADGADAKGLGGYRLSDDPITPE